MTRFGLLAVFALSGLAQTAGLRSVYIMPMPGGLDQYLAEKITRDHVMQVVADPKLADMVLTDKLNDSFTQTLAKLHPRDDEDDSESPLHHTFQSGRSKGTVFLVDSKSRQVVWSDYEKALASATGSRLNKEAERIVKKMPKL